MNPYRAERAPQFGFVCVYEFVGRKEYFILDWLTNFSPRRTYTHCHKLTLKLPLLEEDATITITKVVIMSLLSADIWVPPVDRILLEV